MSFANELNMHSEAVDFFKENLYKSFAVCRNLSKIVNFAEYRIFTRE